MSKSNLIMSADAYTISSDAFASKECKENSVYNFVNRVSPATAFPELAYDSRMVFYGLSHFIKFIEDNPITAKDVTQAERFMSRAHSFGGGLAFNRGMWDTVVNKYGGKLPIRITAIPEGSTFFPNEPVVHVESLEPSFGEIAAHVEARLVGYTSIGTACATLCRHWLDRMRDSVRTDLDILGRKYNDKDVDNIAQWQIHNFGARACLGEEESIVTGMAHLLSFNGTDNFDAAYRAWEDDCDEVTATSIHALAHRNVQGYDREIDAFRALADSTIGDNFRIASFVADCYNYVKAVEDLVTEAIANPSMTYVIRPDSGDAFQTLRIIYDECVRRGVYKVENGYNLPLNVRFIYGDSVKPAKQWEVMKNLRQIGMLPTLWGIWGVGGYIRNSPNRDSFSSAYKLCTRSNKKESVVKLSETSGKLSIPGVNHIMRPAHRAYPTVIPASRVNRGMLHSIIDEVVYDPTENIGSDCIERFKPIKNRSIKEFDELKKFATNNPNFGLKRETLHTDIIKFQDEFFQKFRA